MLTMLLALALQSAPTDTPVLQSPANTGKIIMYRGSTVVGAAVACPIRFQNREIVELGRGKFAQVDVAPGDYILADKISSVTVHVVPGETSYVRCVVKMGIMAGRSILEPVDKDTFESKRAGLAEKPADLSVFTTAQ